MARNPVQDMTDVSHLLGRIDRLCSQAVPGDANERLLKEMEEVLAEGYVRAMYGERHSRRLGKTMQNLVETLDAPEAALEARRIAVQKRTLDQRVTLLRRSLATLREHFLRLGG